MSTRRQRFIAAGLERNGHSYGDAHILAYSAENAAAHLDARGYTYASIAPARKSAKREVPKGGGFTVDQAALGRAIQSLGLKIPVEVRTHNRAGDVRGNYRLRSNTSGSGNYHDIMLKGYLDPKQASRTLWHELAHAMQAERAITDSELSLDSTSSRAAWASARSADKGTSYRQRAIEVEARSFEARAESEPLAHP